VFLNHFDLVQLAIRNLLSKGLKCWQFLLVIIILHGGKCTHNTYFNITPNNSELRKQWFQKMIFLKSLPKPDFVIEIKISISSIFIWLHILNIKDCAAAKPIFINENMLSLDWKSNQGIFALARIKRFAIAILYQSKI
jgi:hypothetical protein